MTATATPADSPVEVQYASDSAAPSGERIEAWVLAALGSPGADGRLTTPGDVCVRVVDEVESASLNERFRARPAPTNVLSFPAEVDVPGTVIWGDIVICAPVVRREAEAQGKRYDDHFAHMVVHGVLHLLGYDHVSAGEAEQMERLESEILGRFGVSDPYGEG